jgi:hypothetical protein
MNLYQTNTREYLSLISEKLDRLNTSSTGKQNHHQDPSFMDPLEWQGRAAIEYMKSKQSTHGF